MKNQFFKLTFLSIVFLAFLGCSSSSDSCETIACKNGGVFVDCECECPQGFKGIDCSEQIEPKSITITKATVKAFPIQQSNGDNWDFDLITPNNELPDVYITIQNSTLVVVYDSPTFFENSLITGGNYLEFISNLKIVNYANPYLVNIYDFDTSGNDDFMASEGFFIYSEFKGFPETIDVIDVADSILVELNLTYEW